MTIGLITFHSVSILLLLLAQPVLRAGFGGLREWFATEEVTKLLAESLRRDRRGELAFNPTSEMAAYIRATPAFWFVASDGTARLCGGNASPIFTARLSDGGKSDMGPELPIGVAIDIWTDGRRVGALIGGQRGSLAAGIWAWITD